MQTVKGEGLKTPKRSAPPSIPHLSNLNSKTSSSSSVYATGASPERVKGGDSSRGVGGSSARRKLYIIIYLHVGLGVIILLMHMFHRCLFDMQVSSK